MSNAKNNTPSLENEEDGRDPTTTAENEEDGLGLDDEEGGIRIGDIYVPPPPPPALTFDCTGPRLIITNIENTDFKSYAGKQTLGPFHKSFTSIVGPNGSGKSNVIDSMLFVFGYRAQRIRCKKISVLIHNSSKFPNLQSCSVSVHFARIVDKDDDAFEMVPDSRFRVTRTAFRDNSSFYAIDGKRVQFKEVGKLLRFHGIDLDHNRFLILQGEVELIAMMKPKAQTEHDSGMLEYLEDIVGCNRFKIPIEQLAAQVETLNEHRAEKLNRIKVVEKEKDELEGPKNEATDYLRDANEITLKRNILCQKDRMEYERQKTQAVAEQEQAKVELDRLNANVDLLKEQAKETLKVANAKAKLMVEYQEHCDKKNEEFAQMERKDLEKREKLKHSKTTLKKVKKNLISEEEILATLTGQPAVLEAKVTQLAVLREQLETDLKTQEFKLSEVMKTLQTDTKALQDEKDVYQKQLIGLKKAVDETKAARDIVTAELDVYISSERKEKDKLQEMKNQITTLEATLKEKQNVFAKTEQALPEHQEKLKTAELDLANTLETERLLNEEIRTKRSRVEEVRNSIQASKSKNRVQTVLMEQKANGNLKGILGRLGDLGAIDAKYDVAISTACGSLDNIVTETLDEAQRCVQFLKDNNVGVATFIALDKMTKWVPYTEQRIETPENIPRLFDLVRVNDERVLPAFYFALKDTLVADTLDQATRIGLGGRKRYRVVTLKGELIDLSGTISGGGTRVTSGRMGQSVEIGRDGQHSAKELSVAELAALETRVTEATREMTEARNKKETLEGCVRQLVKDIAQISQITQKGGPEIARLREQVTLLRQQLEGQQRLVLAAAPNQNRVKELNKQIEAANKDFEKASDEARKIEVKAKRMDDLIKEYTGTKLEPLQKKVSELNTKLESTKREITKAGVDSKTAVRNSKKCETKIETSKTEIVETEQLIITIKEELNEMGTLAEIVLDTLKVHKEELAGVEKELADIQKELQELKKQEKKMNEDNIDIRSAYDKHATSVSEFNGKIKKVDHQLGKLDLHKLGNETDEQLVLPKLTNEELDKVNKPELQFELEVKDEQLKNRKPNMAAIDEFKRKESQYLQRVADLETVTAERDLKRNHHDQFRKQRLNDFMEGFGIITTKLKEVYQMLTLGGDAELELVDSLDPFSEGIVFSVRPPKKSWKNISNLSGGEKTLSSLALVMALHYYRPTPLYVMDEIDAALDFRNVSIVGHYIKERTKNAQFIVISLRNNMYELADRLVGIYKTDDCTKSLTNNPKLMFQQAQVTNGV